MNTPRILTTRIAALLALMFSSYTAMAGTATWRSTGTNGGWHNAANWTPATVPNGPADVATFGTTDQLIPFALVTANTEVNGIVFNPGAPSYSIGGENVTFTISGTGITNNSTIQVLLAAGSSGVLRFQNSATAGNSNVGIAGQNGGTVLFTGSSTGGSAQLVAQSTGAVDISGLTTPGMTAGLIITDNTGSNFFRLGSKTLTVGGANLDSTVSGVIADGGASGGVGGSIVKVGTGTMTYAGSAANTYTGTTFVNEGSLVLNKGGGVDAIRGPLVVGDGLGAAGTAVLQAMAVDNLAATLPVTVNADGRFEARYGINDFIGSLTVNKGEVSLSMGALDLKGPLVMTGGTISGSKKIDLGDTMTQATSDSDGLAATVSAPVFVQFPVITHTFMVLDGPGATDLLISGTIGDDGDFTRMVKAGAGMMVLSGSNSYEGPTTISACTLSISRDANLGLPPTSPRANHLVFDGGTLRATASFTLNANREIALNAGGGTIEVNAGNTVNLASVIVGAGGLTKSGPGNLVFSGAGNNTYVGTTTVNDGILALFKGGGSIAGPLVIGDGLGAASSAVVQTGSSQISDAAPVTIQSDGRLDVDAVVGDQIGSLTLAGGNVQLGSSGGLQVSGALAMTGGAIVGGATTLFGAVTASSDTAGLAATISSAVNLGGATRSFTVNDGSGAVDLNISGAISNGGITKTGAGTLAQGGVSTYSGPTTVIAGKLILSGSVSGSTTVVANGATLQGTGTTGPLSINSGATLIPGLSVGTLTTGNLTLNAGSTSFFELSVASVVGGGVNDLVNINGNLTLDGTLVVTELPGFGDGVYPLFDYSGTLTNNGLDLQASFLVAHPGSIIAIDTVNTRVNLVVIPEPGPALLALMGSATLLLRRR